MAPNGDKPETGTFSRISKYLLYRAVVLFLMVSAGIFLAIVIINYGGYIDNIHRADIDEALSTLSLSMREATHDEVVKAYEQLRWQMEESYGLHRPFILRCIKWFYQAMTLDWGSSYRIGVDRFLGGTEAKVTSIIFERLPYTLLLAGATNIILFFSSIFLALHLSNRHESFLDHLFIVLSPLSSIPNWVYGIILTVIFAGELHLLPFGGLYDTFPPATKLGYVPIVLKHMILPVTAIFLGMFFSTVYSWRTFFLIHSGEDYLEMAKAKGVPTRLLERRYQLRPTLPFIITSFAIMLITFWQGIIVLEVFFKWPGIGALFFRSVSINETRVTIGLMVTFAFLLALSVFFLDIIYVLVDPRVRIGGSGQTVKPVTLEKFHLNPEAALQRLLARLRQPYQRASKESGFSGAAYARSGASTIPVGRSGWVTASVQPPVPHSRAGMAAKPSCPYLKLEGDRGQALLAPSHLCRCTVRGTSERVGNHYQAEVCRTDRYDRCLRLSAGAASIKSTVPQVASAEKSQLVHKREKGQNTFLREFLRYPAAVAGVLIIFGMIGLSIYTLITIPYKEAINRWNSDPSKSRYQIPKLAQPEWVNLFRKEDLPPTIIQNSAEGVAEKTFSTTKAGSTEELITYTVDFPYGSFPQDVIIIFHGQYVKKPFVTLTWLTPDKREFDLGNFSVVSGQRYVVSQEIPQKYLDDKTANQSEFLLTGVAGPNVVKVLFAKSPIADTSVPIKGTYTLRIDAVLFEPGSSLDAELIMYGQVYGLAGTDYLRRDLIVPLLWGMPIALAFGLFGALTTGLLSMVIAAIGVWFGGVVDSLIQRLTEVNMILPTLPIAITIYFLYSKSIWVILGVIIILSIFGSAIKSYRAAFLQARELPYIEAAQSYGASHWRIISRYLVPRIIPLLIPQLVILVPSYVFFEATLAYLNISDPTLPTWGKVVYDALTQGAYQGDYYWVLEPISLIILTAIAFAVVGLALDSILNPRLRRI